MDAKVPLKEAALSQQRLREIDAEIRTAYPSFDGGQLMAAANAAFPQLELKARIAFTAKTIRSLLPDDFAMAAQILLDSLPETPADGGVDSDFGSFKYAPHSQLVAAYGCVEEHLDISLEALRRLTTYYTAEDAIRHFINAFPGQALARLRCWAEDGDHRVRRLASEGTRPKLPWSPRIDIEVVAAFPILDLLCNDDSRFVTISVGNHVNDISTIDPDLALSLLRRWRDSGRQTKRAAAAITTRALRTLVKTGYGPAFEFLGQSPNPRVSVSEIRLRSDRVRIGDSLDFELDVTAHDDEHLTIDYALDAPNKAGSGCTTKVFKLKVLAVAAGETAIVGKSRLIQSTATREVRPGRHTIAVQINGTRMAEAVFDVVT